MQGNMPKALKKRASKQAYLSPSQLTLDGFETPFEQKLDSTNRWVKLAKQIPWDAIVTVYDQQMRNATTGASHINPRVILGSLMIKHLCNLSDAETLLQIQENMYMQYFIGYSSFSKEAPFDSSLFVEIRKRLGIDQLNAINEKIVELSAKHVNKNSDDNKTSGASKSKDDLNSAIGDSNQAEAFDTDSQPKGESEKTHKGRLLIDASACPQDIAYPTDLNLLNDSRMKAEELIDVLYSPSLHGLKKPRTYREKARRFYLDTVMKRNKSRREIRLSIGRQLRYLKRDLNYIQNMLVSYKGKSPLNEREQIYLKVIGDLYLQQRKMYKERIHTIENRIVSIHQPHVRPIVRGKERAKVEFGAKIQVCLVNGYSFLDVLSWDAFNEGVTLLDAVDRYKRRTGCYPEEILADKIYCNRENRRILKEKGIRLLAKPLGRPKAVDKEHVSPGERNPIEGKFGQAKARYGLGRIKARLSGTSESWIASIILVLNLVKLAGQVPIALIKIFLKMVMWWTETILFRPDFFSRP